MGPRPSASENCGAPHFGHAAADASMGPRPSASENARRGSWRREPGRCFNGAEAIGLGKPRRPGNTLWSAPTLQWGRGHRPRKTGRLDRRHHGARGASMGPRPSASENPRPATTEGTAPAASMGPRPSASENAAARDALDHHGIASMGPRPSASENIETMDESIARLQLQWGRGHRPRKTRHRLRTDLRGASFNGAEAIGLGKRG